MKLAPVQVFSCKHPLSYYDSQCYIAAKGLNRNLSKI